jgi:uncharacterized delta-60 repeat protein
VALVPAGVAAAGDIVVSAGDGTHFQVARFTAAGRLDGSFGGGLISKASLLGQAQAVAVVPACTPGAGDVIAAGYVSAIPSPNPNPPLCPSQFPTPAVAEYLSNGSLNPNFPSKGAGGVATVACPLHGGRFNGVTVDKAGNVYAAGEAFSSANSPSTLVAKFSPTGLGNWSTSTETGGPQPTANAVAFTTAVPLSPGGDVLTAGSMIVNGVEDLTVAAFTPTTGVLDTNFGSGGVVTVANPNNLASLASGLTVLPKGNVVAVGVSGSRFIIAQFNPNGSTDTGFGGGNRVDSPSFNATDALASVSYQPSDNILAAAGFATSGANTNLVVTQYNAITGAVNTSFGSGGAVVRSFPFSSSLSAVTMDGFGRTIAAGSFPTVNAVPGMGLIRVLGPTLSVGNAPSRIVIGTAPITVFYPIQVDEPLPVQVAVFLCSSPGSVIHAATTGSCAFVNIPANTPSNTRLFVRVTVAITVPPLHFERPFLEAESANGVLASPFRPIGSVLIERLR